MRIFASAVWLTTAGALAGTPSPLRHLVYAFTYQSNQHGAVSNDPGTSGARSYNGTLGDRGTITVDVLREAPDRGLVVVVSEQGEATRSASPVTCAVYGNTTVACDTGKPTNSEEYTLLRFLGSNFVDPNQVDANGHWAISQANVGVTIKADYTITSNDNGLLTIDETRHFSDTSLGTTTSDAQTKLQYNGRRLVPTSIDEYAIAHQNSGIKGVTTTTYQTTLSLVSDSMFKQ
jgi:hypothetical protein